MTTREMGIFATERRQTMNDRGLDMIVKLSQGNPGAVSVCARIVKESEVIDPDAGSLGGWIKLMTFDDDGLYGPRIWLLYKDVCGGDLTALLALLRARQLGGLAGVTSGAIRHAIDHRGEGIDHAAVLAAVRERLPRFAHSVVPPAAAPPEEA